MKAMLPTLPADVRSRVSHKTLAAFDEQHQKVLRGIHGMARVDVLLKQLDAHNAKIAATLKELDQ